MSKKGLRFVAVNVRSLYPSIEEVRCKFRDFDIIGICETWLNDSHHDKLIDIKTFELFRLDRNVCNGIDKVKRGGGLVLYVGRKFLGHAQQLTACCKCTKDIEQLWVLLEKPNVRKTAICILYRPPNGDIETAIKELSASIDHIQSLHDVEFVIMGDMNINYRNRQSKAFEALKEFERVYNLAQLIKDPTRITPKTKTTIDLIWSNANNVQNSGVLDTILSDHMPVYMTKKKARENKEFKYLMGRSYRWYEKEKFQKDLKDHNNWNNFWNVTRDPNCLWEIMENIILECADYHCPTRRMKIREDSFLALERNN